jgi:hypothetical protein
MNGCDRSSGCGPGGFAARSVVMVGDNRLRFTIVDDAVMHNGPAIGSRLAGVVLSAQSKDAY